MSNDHQPEVQDSLTRLLPIAQMEQAKIISRTQQLTRHIEQDAQVWLPRRLGWLSAWPRLTTVASLAALAVMLALGCLMRELAVRMPLLLALAVVAALLLPAMWLGWRWFNRSWERAHQAEQAQWPDAPVQQAGWWLDIAQRRLVPQRLQGQSSIDLGQDDFSVGLMRMAGGHDQAVHYLHLQLRHPRRGTVAELCSWRFRSYSAKPGATDADVHAAVEELAQALATRMGWRRL